MIGDVCGITDKHVTPSTGCVFGDFPYYTSALCCLAFLTILYLAGAFHLDRLNILTIPEIKHELADESKFDKDVSEERRRINAMDETEISSGDHALVIKGLRKVFPPKKIGAPPLEAVQNLCLGLARGEVFGLLGANGAGKTTTISMIIRALYPSAGNIHVCGVSVLDQFCGATKHLGVVTQHNTLFDNMSCVDHLYLFARLRGVPNSQIKATVEENIRQLELAPYKNKLAKQLSGGMKRKLCVAIALIGEPDLVLLDEPSAGLDPVSRRNLWDTLIKTMQNRAVILTTHSMEEAEALCTRIGIMVKGQLRVIGTPQHLKEKHGSGYEIILKLSHHQEDQAEEPADDNQGRINALTEYVTGVFQDASLLSNNGGLLTFRVPKETMKIGNAFATLQDYRAKNEISDYIIAQPTLEQVFVKTVFEFSGDERPGSLSLRRQSSHHRDQSLHVRSSLGDTHGSVEPPTHPEESWIGIRKEWLGLDRRSHAFMATVSGIFAYICWSTMGGANIGLAFFNFAVALTISIIGCMGCCCFIPPNPDDDDE